jgi:toxin ParE1/3/4
VKRRFLSRARVELREAFNHYEAEKAGLGREFAAEVTKALQDIVESPLAWPPMSATIRKRNTRRFPYGIYYAVEEDELVVVAVLHLHRQSGLWEGRM